MGSNHHRGSVLLTEKITFPKIRVANALFILTMSCSILLGAKQLWAAPTSAIQAEKVVRGWLRVDAEPMGTRLGGQVQRVDTFADETGQPLYYVAYLEPQGFVILPADDQIEPVIAFARQGKYDPSINNPLGALVNNDLPARVRTARLLTAERKRGALGKALGRREAALQLGADKAQSRWRNLRHFGEASDTLYADDPPITSGFIDISDIRVAPLLLSEWDQGNVDGAPCYNYYTPNNYVCGCVATAMAQLMRYHEYPILGIGRNNFLIKVDYQTQAAKTRGGDGRGGPYVWSEMTLVPETGVTEEQRQAIGALCFDAGITAHMSYTAGSSGAWMDDALQAMLETFGYANGIHGFNDWENVGEGLIEMVNPNLDGKSPVLLGITNEMSGHAIVCDGYGYHGISMYHHLNMGWGGYKDLWYHLPTVLDFEIVRSCTYNVFPSGSGEIISGRVISMAEEPIAGVEITGEVVGCDPCDPCTVCVFTTFTDNNGIYALLSVPSDANFVITAEKEDFYFDSQEATTGLSEDMQPVAGNVWGIDFVAQPPPPDHDECEQAIPIQLNMPSYYTTFGASGDSHSDCSDGTDNKDVWHTFTPPSSGYFQFSLCDSTFDTTLVVYDDCNELSRVELGCNDDSELCGPQSELILQLDTDEMCYIRVAGVNAATGAYVINITEANFEKYNDDCEDAISLVDGIPFEGNTDDATETMIGEEPLTSSCCLLDEIDVWHSYTPAEDCCDVIITLCGSQLEDTSLSVYDFCGGTELACNDDSDQCEIGSYQSYLTMPMQAGVTYYIRVAGFNRTTGAYTITAIGGGGGMFSILPPYEFTWLYGEPIQDCCLEAVGGEEPYHNWQANQIADYYSYQTEANSFETDGTSNNWQEDDAMWSFALGFPFNFYGTEYTSVNVCSNGFLDFVENLTHNNNSTQKLLENVIIAPLWDDLDTSVGDGSDIYVQAGPDEVTFRWQAVTWQDGTPCNFSVTLYEDSRIRFDYGSGNTNLTPTVGISAGNGSDYLIISGHDEAETLTDADSVAITFHQSSSALPPGVSLNPDTGCFSGEPQSPGDYNAIIEVTDSFYPQVTTHEEFVFHVIAPNDPDLDDNGYVNLLDFAIISTQWLADNCDDPTNWCDNADINMSGRVNMADLLIMVENWLGGE